ncbi:MAG: hypothetical protein HZA04_02850 [Nitrospinae bacterium]|nr:hypothetical protein [Nitrospinota bacterium]
MKYLPLMLLWLTVSAVEAKQLGTFGAVYPIAERDALEEILERVSRAGNLETLLGKERIEEAVRNFQPQLSALPKAEKDDTFLADLIWVNDQDIPAPGGGILYPKGYRFNPAELIFLPNILVVIDGADPAQVAWFQSSPYVDDPRTMLLLTGGPWYELGEKLKMPTFYINADIVERFKLRRVPSTVWQEGTSMRVNEYEIEEKKEKGDGKD